MRVVRLLAGVALVLACAPSVPASSYDASAPRTWRVGPGRTLTTPSAAAAVARDGDTVLIDPATYSGDVAMWTQDDLTLRGDGGRAHLRADGNNAQGKAIWVIAGDRTIVDRIEFSGATVADRNGAGIRQEGTGLTVTRSWFHDNENGILTGADPESDVVIRRSRFFRNGAGDGYSHNLYVGAVRSLRVVGSWLFDADTGHELKSRAATNTIIANRISDGDATASYSIDLPNGGRSLVAGNVVVQGPRSENSALVSYGAEGLSNPLASALGGQQHLRQPPHVRHGRGARRRQPRPPAQQPPRRPGRDDLRSERRSAGQPPRGRRGLRRPGLRGLPPADVLARRRRRSRGPSPLAGPPGVRRAGRTRASPGLRETGPRGVRARLTDQGTTTRSPTVRLESTRRWASTMPAGQGAACGPRPRRARLRRSARAATRSRPGPERTAAWSWVTAAGSALIRSGRTATSSACAPIAAHHPGVDHTEHGLPRAADAQGQPARHGEAAGAVARTRTAGCSSPATGSEARFS